MTVGLLILAFVAYQLWGTGIWANRSQNDLTRQFDQAREAYLGTPPPGDGTAPAPPIPAEGQAGGVVKIPKIGVDWVFVEGVTRDDLKKGPGHYPETPYPGTLGNAAIAGHRTTYGAPFYEINELEPGDRIIVETAAGTFTYAMTEQLIVRPDQVEVVANTPDAELTLTSCHPRYSAAQRIVVKAKLVPDESAQPAPPPPRPTVAADAPTALDEALGGDPASRGPAIAWGLAAAAVGGLWWWAFRRWRHPLTWIAGFIPFTIPLFFFYVYLERLLPAGY